MFFLKVIKGLMAGWFEAECGHRITRRAVVRAFGQERRAKLRLMRIVFR